MAHRWIPFFSYLPYLEHLGQVLFRLPTYLFELKLSWFPTYLPLPRQELVEVIYLPT